MYVGLVIFYVGRLVRDFERDAQEGLLEESASSQNLANKKGKLYLEKINLENETIDIFTLYEIMKDITKSLREKEAFEIFKKKLADHIKFKDCRLYDAGSEEIHEFKKFPGHFVFTLQSKRKTIGHLVIEGLAEEGREKFSILAHQFALAFRRVQLYEEIERIAITDSLTDVHTRRYIMERFQEEILRSATRKSSLSFLMVDVDFFKSFNDQHGHLTGDMILREIGILIKENIREIDVAGRYGGEEFCVVLPDTDQQGAEYAAERIRQAVENALIKAYDTQVRATVSIGLSTYPPDGEKIEELVDKADGALYKAKKEGRNKVYSPGMLA
jgi:diguanylate cyclase (GGDEF)-like protein